MAFRLANPFRRSSKAPKPPEDISATSIFGTAATYQPPDATHLLDEKRYDEAALLLRESYKRTPRNRSTLEGLARLAEARGNTVEAVSWLREIPLAKGDFWQRDIMIVGILARGGQQQRAVDVLLRLLKDTSGLPYESDVQFWSSINLDFFRGANQQRVFTLFTSLVAEVHAKSGENSNGLRILARIARLEGRFLDAHALLSKALMLRPSDLGINHELNEVKAHLQIESKDAQ